MRPAITRSLVVVLVLVATALYARNLDDYFLGDDFDLIHTFHGQPLRYSFELLFNDESSDVWTYLCREPGSPCPDPDRHGFLRPLKIWLLQLDHAVWGTNPLGFHLTSTAFFVINVVLAFQLLRLLLPEQEWFAFFGALTVAIHPLFAEIVPSLTYREETIANAFGIGAVYGLLRHRLRAGPSWVFHLLYAAALLTKESGVSFLGVAVGYDFLAVWFADDRRRELTRRAKTYVPTVLILAGYFALRLAAFGNLVGGHGETDFLDPARFIGFHVSLLDYLFSRPVFALHAVPGVRLVAFGVLALLLARVAQRRQVLGRDYFRDLLFLGPVWYAGSTAISYGVYFSPRHIVTPVVGFALCAAFLLAGTVRGAGRRLEGVIVACAVVLSGIVFLAPALEMSRRFENAARSVSTIRAEIELRTADLPAGAKLLLVGVPERQAQAPPYFGHGLMSALKLPFTATDLANRVQVHSVGPGDRDRAVGTEAYDRVLEFVARPP